MKLSVKKAVQMGIFVALGLTLGFALIHIPNVELITATIFISGYLLGIKEGIVVGLLTETLFSLMNPFGVAAFPLFVAQVFSMSLVGCTGGMLAKQKKNKTLIYHIQLGLTGFYLLHILSNTVIFVSIIPVLLNRASKTGWFFQPALQEDTP
jgi:uncharacterized membrane protein